jgi:hypothetical protein
VSGGVKIPLGGGLKFPKKSGTDLASSALRGRKIALRLREDVLKPKNGSRKKGFAGGWKKTAYEGGGISNRPIYPIFISPLTRTTGP